MFESQLVFDIDCIYDRFVQPLGTDDVTGGSLVQQVTYSFRHVIRKQAYPLLNWYNDSVICNTWLSLFIVLYIFLA